MFKPCMPCGLSQKSGECRLVVECGASERIDVASLACRLVAQGPYPPLDSDCPAADPRAINRCRRRRRCGERSDPRPTCPTYSGGHKVAHSIQRPLTPPRARLLPCGLFSVREISGDSEFRYVISATGILRVRQAFLMPFRCGIRSKRVRIAKNRHFGAADSSAADNAAFSFFRLVAT